MRDSRPVEDWKMTMKKAGAVLQLKRPGRLRSSVVMMSGSMRPLHWTILLQTHWIRPFFVKLTDNGRANWSRWSTLPSKCTIACDAYTHTQRERERERERAVKRKKERM